MTEPTSQNLSLDVAFQEAAARHRAGQLREAEQRYREILRRFPSHADANHNLGILSAQAGFYESGFPYFEAALASNPAHEQILQSYVNAMVAAGQLQRALKKINDAIQNGMQSAGLNAMRQSIEQGLRDIKNAADPTESELKHLAALYSVQRFAELETHANKLIEKYPYSGLVWKMLAAALQAQNKNSLMAKRKAVQFLPSDADLHFNLGNEFYAQGAIPEAQQCYRSAIQLDPKHVDAYGNLGVLLNRAGMLSEAAACYQKVIEFKPDGANAHYILGGLLSSLGRHDDAVRSCQTALRIQPNSAEALSNLGLALHGLGQLDDAASSIRKAIDMNPAYVEAYINLGNVVSDQGQLVEAKACYTKALELQPDSALAYYNLASMLHDERDFVRAEQYFKRSLQINPGYVNAYTNLGTTLMELGKCDEALQCYQQARLFKPHSAQALCNVGSALHELGRLDESVECYRNALKIDPDFADAHGNLGGIFMQLGKLDEAKDYLYRALELTPDDARVLTTALIYLSFDPNAAQFAQLERVYKDRAALPLNVRISFCIAYGKAMESIGEYDRSFAAYEEGNRLHYQDHPFDEAAEDHAISHTMRTMTKARFERFALADNLAANSDQKGMPIFIVGMQRSGSTLIEQILSSHPEVYGAGELLLLGQLAGRADRLIQESSDDATTLAALRQLGDSYLAEVGKKAPEARFIIDKMPHNFYFVGLIHLMFPQAKIIHSLRDPIDTCFSGYALRFGAANEFTYDLETLGRYYMRYQKLMAHWHAALPANRILDVQYEKNVAEPEQEARRMLNYLGLSWDASCLDFHKNTRTVRTASVTQVRKPLYSSSVARWKHFEKHLGPLISILQPGGVTET